MKRKRLFYIARSPIAVFGLLVLLLSGCEEDVTAVIGHDRVYSLYGVLKPESDTQWVRVFPIEERLRPTPSEPLDAHVTTTDLRTGEVRVWRDSLLVEADGHYAHVYWSIFHPGYGHSYHLEARRSDGAYSFAEVMVPPQTEVVVQEPAPNAPATVPVMIRAPRLMHVTAEYLVSIRQEGAGEGMVLPFLFEYDQRIERVAPDWRISVMLHLDYSSMLHAVQRDFGYAPGTFSIELLNLTLELAVVNEEWLPVGGSFDPMVLAQERALWNVQNGYGFVGAGYYLEKSWLPPGNVLRAAGFRVPEAGAP